MSIQRANGFSFIEVMIVTSILAVVMAGVMHLTVSLMRSTSIGEARSSRVALGEAIRVQLSQKPVCLNSFRRLPTSWLNSAAQPISVNLNSTAKAASADLSQLVEANRELQTFNSLVVSSFDVVDLKLIGSTQTKSFYAGGIDLSVKSRKLSSVAFDDRFQMASNRIATIVFEIPSGGGAPVSCYATNPELDLEMVVETMCSIQGGKISDGVCTIPKKSGGDCKPKASLSPSKPWDSCKVQLPVAVKREEVPADQRGDYNWLCRTVLAGHDFWIGEGDQLVRGQQNTGECKATTKNVSKADLKEGNIPHSSRCSSVDDNGGSEAATCVDGVWVDGQTSTPGTPDPGGLGG